ncbi:tRNA (adenosine(37)-N6)-dimethylallyltransferase MiaA [Thiomicrorhabdus sp. Milos-T2]|uniref:tRNA (adenosine(37)-N6)-dimethylallyltransferase MiaA n=1 Tax=Thiomicrorhabdus sp. Milos-T2 TaxID=90814 RepID=UPI00068FEA34|nr:tRNA (adenosine(37)-N6)-dimethylallyltransferase MiaA [Thiomicrorhabdus sp. Milos-T2]
MNLKYQNLVNQLIANKKCLAIMGPTASGKSQLSMLLAEQMPIEIISVDSALIYRDMDIGTAKPSQQELDLVPHHLINTHDASETYSASEFVEDVNRLVTEIYTRNRLPVLVGGTMMYFNALQQGLSDLPPANEKIREKWLQIWHESPNLLHEKLLDIDPVSAERIHKNDPQRLVRAIEVYEITGKSLTEFRAQPKKGLPDFELIKIALIPENRAKLHKQIEVRFLSMIESGFLQEMKGLYQREDLNEDMTSIRSVGYRQAWLFLEGEYDYETFVYKGLVATRQLAKRQLTWLRKEPDVTVIDPYKTSPEERVKLALSLLNSKV